MDCATFARDKREVEVKEFSHEYSREYSNKIGPGPPAYSRVDYGDDPCFNKTVSSLNTRSTSASIGRAKRLLTDGPQVKPNAENPGPDKYSGKDRPIQRQHTKVCFGNARRIIDVLKFNEKNGTLT